MLERISEFEEQLAATWNDMGVGAPTVIALAQLCGRAIMRGDRSPPAISLEAKAILFAARQRGIIEIKGSYNAYESPSRLLTVYVEVGEDSKIRFRDSRDPRQNIRFLEGFRELCNCGLIIHHLYHEFSLTNSGFAEAEAIVEDEVNELLAFRQDCGSG